MRSSLVKLQLLPNKEPVDTIRRIAHTSQAERVELQWVNKFKEHMQRQVFEVIIQAAVGKKIVTCETLNILILHIASISRSCVQMLYGKNPDAFEKEVFEGLHTAAKEHEVWRRRGSVGKWHNFAVEVSRSDTWTDMLMKVQAVESQLSDDAQLKKHRPVGVVVDNATRWLSQFLMIERALVLRPFYNSFVQRASNEWEKVNLTRAGHIKKGSKLPFFLTEENRMTADDWHVLGTLYDILLDFQLVVRGLEGDGQGKHRRKVEENEIDPPLSGTSWDLIHAYEFLLETLESAKRAVANFPDGHHLAVNINLGWLKLNEYYEHLNDSPLVYGAAVLHPAYRWALFDDLWGDDDERRLWITKAKEMVQDLWEREYRDLERGAQRSED
ncbi:hypothetical protein PG989_005722 [Apiospora arundinis]